jgi:YidC/Oxa1 family membrane protein insertase
MMHLLSPLVFAISALLGGLNAVTHNYGWAIVLLAVLVRGAFWPLAAMQFRSSMEMQRLNPLLRELRTKHKGDNTAINRESMSLYREHGVNPAAGCLPLLLQLPILFSLFGALSSLHDVFATESWLWIGSSLSERFPNILATSLSHPDYVLLTLYVISMYFAIRLTNTTTDPEQTKQFQIMALATPAMIAFVGRSWPSAIMLYWLTFNAIAIAQQFMMLRRLQPVPLPVIKDRTPRQQLTPQPEVITVDHLSPPRPRS